MTKLNVDIHDSVVDVINKIREINDSGIELIIPEGALVFENILNIRLIQKETDKLDKSVSFTTQDEQGLNLIHSLNEESDIDTDFIAKEISLADITDDKKYMSKVTRKKIPFTIPRVNTRLPKLNMKGLKILPIILIIFGILGVGGIFFISKMHKVNVKIVVNSQPLTKSIQIQVAKDAETNAETKTIKGTDVQTTISKTDKIATTGERLIGEQAEGEIKIYNKTLDEKKIKKGTKVKYDDKDLEYELKDDVTVPAATEETPDEVTTIITAGEETVKVQAKDIGDKYNIDKGKDLVVDDYNKDDVFAKTNEDFSGGKSEVVMIVDAKDIEELTQKLTEDITNDAEKELEGKVVGDRKFIKGSQELIVTNTILSHQEGEETDALELTLEMNAAGLAYSTKDIDKMLDKLLEGFIPEGYVLSTQDKDVNIEILGNTETTTLSNTTADLQVTIKTSVVTNIDENKLKDDLKGKSLVEGQKILSGIRNIQNYEIKPNIPILKSFPKNKDNISIEVDKK